MGADGAAVWAANQAGGEINRIPVGGPGMVPNLLSGNVDAIVAYPPLSYKVLQAGTGRSLIDFVKAMPATAVGSAKGRSMSASMTLRPGKR